MKIYSLLAIILLGCAPILAACQTAPTTELRQSQLIERSGTTIDVFREADPTIDRFFESAHAYAVFPSIARGGAGVGGAHGRGVAYEAGRPVGWCDVSQGTIGFQLGGQSFSQIIFFETPDAFANFRTGNYAFAANASAVAATHGAAVSADYERGVAVFIQTRGGLMYEAAIGGQKFGYEPME